ncbi:gap junction delta-4 protein [Chanos chanos]|uniref:Gap junction protein n=1 Tax=Chanos chanos TaxID=29144 RepID=A0A6J2UUE4_CHACN|nr:gap junction delta-4 protein [Chanos chanos]
MGRQGVSEVILIALNYNITIIGKVWLILMVFLRVLVLLFAGYPLYQDEQERFVCNTIQPGCANVCYDLFAPLSLFRFWLVQLTTLCLPYIIFVIYIVHKVTAGLAVDQETFNRIKAGSLYKIRQESFRKASLCTIAAQVETGRVQRFTGAYIFHLFFRILLEAGFGAAHYYLFGFYIPKRFMCQQVPCTTTVDCYISRPTEKTVMLNFMLGVSALSLLLNIFDLVCAIKRSVRQSSKRKMLVQKMYEEEQYYLSPSDSRCVDANVSPGSHNLEALGSFRKRRVSKSSADETASGRMEEGELHPSATHVATPLGPGIAVSTNTNGNNDCPPSQEEGMEREGSEVALCPPDPLATPRSIRVSKRSRLKPPPPPRKDKPAGTGALDVSTATAVCTRRVGQYTLVEMATGPDLPSGGGEGQEKRSEWV